ncbi:MAG: metallophosphoesterase [Clostridia bacterium]|nr:metallophosphoesterase [Clostridia bacterium]
MKLFLIMSDTHGELKEAKRIVDQCSFADAVIHLGDYVRDVKSLERQYPEKEFIWVQGNCDYGFNEPLDKLIDVEGKRVFLTHGHRYDVKSGLGRLESRALQEKADVILFGHTHIPFLKKGPGLCMLNPGSLGQPRGFSGSTFALLEIGNGLVEARILDA